jgi:hypothetical protein
MRAADPCDLLTANASWPSPTVREENHCAATIELKARPLLDERVIDIICDEDVLLWFATKSGKE